MEGKELYIIGLHVLTKLLCVIRAVAVKQKQPLHAFCLEARHPVKVLKPIERNLVVTVSSFCVV